MYLISVEGGDGSGKGEAARIISELLNSFPFPKIHSTHEPTTVWHDGHGRAIPAQYRPYIALWMENHD